MFSFVMRLSMVVFAILAIPLICFMALVALWIAVIFSDEELFRLRSWGPHV
jgi:hypothetical protein